MANTAETSQLSPQLIEFLQTPQLVLVTTLDSETKWPTNNLISWVYAADETTIRLSADAKGRLIGNIRADERLLLTIMAGDACHCIEGTAKVIADNLENVSLKLACAEVKVRAVRDVTFWGGKITQLPDWDVTYDKELKNKLDTGVFAAMKAV